LVATLGVGRVEIDRVENVLKTETSGWLARLPRKLASVLQGPRKTFVGATKEKHGTN